MDSLLDERLDAVLMRHCHERGAHKACLDKESLAIKIIARLVSRHWRIRRSLRVA